MRALCEACGKPQPPDWSPGDQCVHCGKGVRRDVRCFWCAKWTPAAKFCRSCGAETVESRLYGAARMLKDAGTDRFTVPKQLKDFDPDQVENFSRIYQRHSTAVARHVDELRFLERFLRQTHWSAALEDQLTPQLPWPEETLARYSAPAPPAGDDLSTAKAIAATSPFPVTRSLAALVRLRHDDWDAVKDASSAFRSTDPALRAEAALALTSWRVLWAVGRPRADEGRAIFEELQRSSFKLEAAVRLGQLGREEPELLREALASADPETSFAAALVLGDVDRLQAALRGGNLEKAAAGHKLVALGVIKPVVEIVEKSPLEVQRELVEALVRRKSAAPEAADTLLQIVETTDDKTLRERSVRVLCREIRPEWVLRLARAAKGDTSIYQSLLQAEGLTPEGALELGDFLLSVGRFAKHQYGVSTLAEKGRMPFHFVPERFPAAGAEVQEELLRFAELQLEHGGPEDLHRFVMNAAFGPHPAKVRAAAWWVLHRWYRSQGEYAGRGPLALKKDVVARFFGSFAAFLPRLAAVLRDVDTLKEVGYYEMMAHLLDSADEEGIAAIQAEGSGADDLMDALFEAMRGDFWPNTVEGMIKLASRVGCHPRWRAQALDAVRGLGKRGNYHYDKALRRLELAVHDIPEESEWTKLPASFVPSRFAGATAEGKKELLELADHQLVHRKEASEPVLLPFLLGVALKPGDPDVRAEALRMHDDRARGAYEGFSLRREAVERGFGPFEDFVALVAQALRDPGPAEDLLESLFRDPKPDDLPAGGDALVAAMLERAGGSGSDKLRRTLVRHLAVSGARPAWRDRVVAELDRLHADPRFDLASEAERALRALRPPPPKQAPAPTAHVSYGTPEPDDEDENAAPGPEDWAAKQKIVEKLGTELQKAIFRIMAGSGTPEEKSEEASRLSQEYQAKIKELYS